MLPCPVHRARSRDCECLFFLQSLIIIDLCESPCLSHKTSSIYNCGTHEYAQFEPIKGLGSTSAEQAQVTGIFSGWKNECCTKRNAYHLVFPENATAEEKITLVGSSILLDVVYMEQDQDNGGGGGGGGGGN